MNIKLLVSFMICSNRAGQALEKALQAVSLQPASELWECVLVDNGFDAVETLSLKKKADAWFAGRLFRIIREDRPGLGYARRAGFKEVLAPWVVMLDDDNYLDKDFVDQFRKLLESLPELGGVSACVYPLLPNPGSAWQAQVANRCLSVTQQAIESLENLPRLYAGVEVVSAPRPPGGGMIIRKELALKWCEESQRRGTIWLERTGSSLVAAGDEEIWRVLISSGRSIAVTNRLRIAHDLPRSRFGWSYLWRLNYWMAWSYAWLNAIDRPLFASEGWIERWKHSIRHCKLLLSARGKEMRMTRWMDWASWLGAEAGRKAFLTANGKPHSTNSG